MSRTRLSLTRRRLLQSTGLAAGSLFLPSLLSQRARAQEGPAKRIVIVFTQHGTVYPNWRMRHGGQGENVSFETPLGPLVDTDFSQILRPLHAMRNKVTVLDGLSMATAEGDEIVNEHTRGTAHALTGAFLQDGVVAGGKSIDQLIADQIALAGRFNSLELAVIGAASGGAVYRGAGQPLPADADPNATFSRLFPGNAEPDPGEETPQDRINRVQSSVLDLVGGEFERLAPRLSGEDRLKLEAHRDLVRGVEERIGLLQGVSCERPAQPALDNNFESRTYYDTRFTAMSQVLAAALACDLTRVVTLQLAQLTNEHCDVGPGDIHAEFAHQQDTEPGATVMTNYGRTHAEQFAELLSILDSVPEGNGTLLDNTLVVWCGELASGTHKFLPWPVVIGGGGNLGLQTGRYVRWAPEVPTPHRHPTWEGVPQLIGPPHNRLWINLASKVGADVPVLGESSLTTASGQTIDTTTPLDRI